MYQPSARKYRPQTFAQVFGQKAIIATLKNALRSRKLPAAYLFSGARGTGKTTLARLVAKAVNCSQLTDDAEPCNACPSCLDVQQGRSLDLLEIDGASNRGIDDVRQIIETAGYAPASAAYKIYLIDEVHMLTKEAFNALLKILEEPPPSVKFLFATTEPHKVLPTILSRCQRFALSRLSPSDIKEKLSFIAAESGVSAEDDALQLIASLSEGALRDAESLFDQAVSFADGAPLTRHRVEEILGLLPQESLCALDQAIQEGRTAFAFELASSLADAGKDYAFFLDQLIEHFRRHLHTSSLFPEEQVLYILDYLLQQQAVNPLSRSVHLEMLLLHLIRTRYRIPVDALVQRLVDLESKLAPPPPPLEEKLIQAIKEKAPSKQEYDTLMRFAAVELEGSLKKG
jgi:DNA polymerase-3 subunit gamma/tau